MSGKQDETPYERNQCLTSRKCSTGSNLEDMGRVRRTPPVGRRLRNRSLDAGEGPAEAERAARHFTATVGKSTGSLSDLEEARKGFVDAARRALGLQDG